MARIKLTLIGSTGVVVHEVSESMVFHSAEFIYNTLYKLLIHLGNNFRKLDATGKIPMEPIELTPAQVGAVAHDAIDKQVKVVAGDEAAWRHTEIKKIKE